MVVVEVETRAPAAGVSTLPPYECLVAGVGGASGVCRVQVSPRRQIFYPTNLVSDCSLPPAWLSCLCACMAGRERTRVL